MEEKYAFHSITFKFMYDYRFYNFTYYNAFLYNGLAVGNGIDELRPFGIPLNIFSFVVVLVVQTISLLLAYKDNK